MKVIFSVSKFNTRSLWTSLWWLPVPVNINNHYRDHTHGSNTMDQKRGYKTHLWLSAWNTSTELSHLLQNIAESVRPSVDETHEMILEAVLKCKKNNSLTFENFKQYFICKFLNKEVGNSNSKSKQYYHYSSVLKNCPILKIFLAESISGFNNHPNKKLRCPTIDKGFLGILILWAKRRSRQY